MNEFRLHPFKRITALDGSEWYAAWGLTEPNVEFANGFVGKEIEVGPQISSVTFLDPVHWEEKTFIVHDCDPFLWAYTELTNGIWAQAVRGKNAPAPQSLGDLILKWLRWK